MHRRPPVASLLAPLAATLLAALSAAPAHAVPVTDPAGDILSTYAGVPAQGDVDVLFAEVIFNGSGFHLSATMADTLGQTPGALYVWGFDRGAGTERFATLPGGVGVLFDSVVVIDALGTATVRTLAPGVAVTATLTASLVGDTLSVDVPLSALPSAGFAPGAYTWNLWPRVGSGNNNQITDFAPDGNADPALANALVTVPEPASLALAAGGLGLIGRRRLRHR